MDRTSRRALPLGYRIGWRFRYAAVSVFGPAQLGSDDPQLRLRRERERRLEQVRRDRGSTTP
ncbi:hypothetical protein [Phycicoccus flavus]|uniref:hypothetical protein n=1 Tax=Phycicoccus flavus TaxID=2502783 RepID=UPI000FEC1586|nr:hypothetical protein [Phycicoccus flavus]NHA68269.1 hypothetical protein [Phycicoccus flavus]NHA70169.1 hypothetical protein [Phycicoccus flavus]